MGPNVAPHSPLSIRRKIHKGSTRAPSDIELEEETESEIRAQNEDPECEEKPEDERRCAAGHLREEIVVIVGHTLRLSLSLEIFKLS